jgi:uncharacterized membrane protein YfhO
VNAQSQTILMTNGAFRGLELPKGKSEIVMTYRPANLKLSIALTLLALFTTSVFIGWPGKAAGGKDRSRLVHPPL